MENNEQNKPITAGEYWNENSMCFPEGDFMQEDQQVMKWEEFKAYSAAKDAEIAKLREELGEVKQGKWREGGSVVVEYKEYNSLIKVLESVKKERDEHYAELKRRTGFADHVSSRLDEAVKLLKYYNSIEPHKKLPLFAEGVHTFLSRLSSGETKPVSPWISVEENPPTEGYWMVWYNGNVKAYYHADKKIFKDEHHIEVYPEYYAPLLPAPPESTDKK